jgi:hypothetical protein
MDNLYYLTPMKCYKVVYTLGIGKRMKMRYIIKSYGEITRDPLINMDHLRKINVIDLQKALTKPVMHIKFVTDYWLNRSHSTGFKGSIEKYELKKFVSKLD